MLLRKTSPVALIFLSLSQAFECRFYSTTTTVYVSYLKKVSGIEKHSIGILRSNLIRQMLDASHPAVALGSRVALSSRFGNLVETRVQIVGVQNRQAKGLRRPGTTHQQSEKR